MTLNERLTHEPLSFEDLDLLKTIADQAAAGLLNLKLADQIARAKEAEAFQTVSAFLIHDLKNLAPVLSMTAQNLQTHYDDPEFRQDALRAVSRSVERINSLCARLANLAKPPEINLAAVDPNAIISAVLANLNGTLKAPVKLELGKSAKVLIDAEEMQKVVLNLLLNANDAVNGAGEIQVGSGQQEDWVSLWVQDNGCGMSREFIKGVLFHPFQSTKKNGLGIGLYQSKKIVEAHHGKIKVESEEGNGTKFEILLPAAK